MSWAEVKGTLNSSLGTSSFLPLDKQILQIRDNVDKSEIAAGAGDFSRTLFEWGGEIVMRKTDPNSNIAHKLCIIKAVIPKSGLYKVSWSYNLTQPANSNAIGSFEIYINRLLSQNNASYTNDMTALLQSTRAASYANISIGESISNIFTMYTEKPKLYNVVLLDEEPSTSYKSFETYYEFTEGTLLLVVAHALSSGTIDYTATIRDIKITY